MADDTEESSTLAVLSKRVDFRGWKQSMLLYAMEKGDVDGIFTDDGSDAARGYQLIAALSHARRQSWKLLSGKLTGRVGRQITNPTLRDVWNTSITSASVAVPSQAQYQFALAMRAVEDACGGVEETAKQIARTRFKVALMTFEEQSTKGDVKAGFETYADGIRVAEQKLAHAGVIMSDEEKKEKFFAGFNPRSAQWNSVKTFWMQSDHTFDDILSRGVQQQHSLDAVEAEDNASGVRSFMAKSMRDEERNNERDYDRFNKRTKRDEESAQAHYTERGAGGKGGRGNGIDEGEVSEWQSDDEGEKLELVEYVHGNRTVSRAELLGEGLKDGKPPMRVRLVESGRTIRADVDRVLRGGEMTKFELEKQTKRARLE